MKVRIKKILDGTFEEFVDINTMDELLQFIIENGQVMACEPHTRKMSRLHGTGKMDLENYDIEFTLHDLDGDGSEYA